MNLLKKYLCLSTLLLAVSSSASAEGFYLRWDLGFGGIAEQKVKNTTNAFGYYLTGEANADFDYAFQGQVGVGYVFTPSWRVDLTGVMTDDYDVNAKCEASLVCPPIEKTQASISTNQVFANGYFDIGPSLFKNTEWFNPYVGLGLGYARIESSKLYPSYLGNPVLKLDGITANNFAWRATGGVTFALNKQVSLDIAYLYTGAGPLKLHRKATIAPTFPPVVFSIQKPGEVYMNMNQGMAGLRVQF